MAPGLRKRKALSSQPKDDADVPKKKAAKTQTIEKRKAPDTAFSVPAKKQKSVKLLTTVANEETASVQKGSTKTGKAEKKGKKVSKNGKAAEDATPASNSADEPPADAEEEEHGGEVDDTTQALVSTLDSDDAEDLGEEDNKDAFKKGQDVGQVPKTIRKLPDAGQANVRQETGVVYLGRIPHGFAEREMRSYFSQFGDVTRLRLSRNKRTGKSKHFAFIEFADKEVAEIVAQTMDSYLLYGRILRARVVPKARIHADLFKGANRRFKAIPWNKMAGRHLEKPAGESTWNTRIEKERRRRTARAEKLKETMGYEFEGPELKVVQGSAAVGLEDGEGESTEAIEAPRTAAEKEPERPVTDRAGDEPADTIGTSGQSKKIKAGKKSGKKNKVNKA